MTWTENQISTRFSKKKQNRVKRERNRNNQRKEEEFETCLAKASEIEMRKDTQTSYAVEQQNKQVEWC